MFNLALRNLRRCWQDYLAYFLSLSAITTTLNLFLGLRYNPFISAAISSRDELVRASQVASVLILLIGFNFAWYSSDFFLRKRYREMGLYNLYGMSRTRIGGMIFSENLLLGAAAVVLGSALGFVLSKLFVMSLLNILNLQYAVGLRFSLKALRDTALYFSLLLSPIVLRSAWLLARYDLASLFRAEKAAQSEPKIRRWLGFLSLVVLLGGYALALSSSVATVAVNFLLVAALTVVSSYGIVSTFLPWIIKSLRNRHALSWRKGRLIAWSQLEYRIRSNVNLLVTISITGAAAMIALGVGFNATQLIERQNNAVQPWDLSFVVQENDARQDSYHSLVLEKINAHGLTLIAQSIQPVLRYNSRETVAGSAELRNGEDTLYYAFAEFLPLSAFPGSSNQGRTVPLIQSNIRGDRAAAPQWLPLPSGEELQLQESDELPPVNFTYHGSYFVFIDDTRLAALRALPGAQTLVSYNYQVDKREALGALTKELKPVLEEHEFHSHEFNAYYVRIFRLYLLLGFLVGLVFLASSCSILFFKQMAETRADEARYRALLNIGAPYRTLSGVIALQTLPLFIIPLALGVVHSLVALNTMAVVLKEDFTLPITITVLSFTIIFLSLAALTTRTYRKAVLRPLRT